MEDLTNKELVNFYDNAARQEHIYYINATATLNYLLQHFINRYITLKIKNSVAQANSILDIGSGNGIKLAEALRESNCERICLVDISEEMLKLARSKILQVKPDIHLSTIAGDTILLDSNKHSNFDLVLCIGMLNHCANLVSRILDMIEKVANNEVILAFCHSDFISATKVGQSYHQQNIPFEVIAINDVEQHMDKLGYRVSKRNYLLGKKLSPLVIMHFLKR